MVDRGHGGATGLSPVWVRCPRYCETSRVCAVRVSRLAELAAALVSALSILPAVFSISPMLCFS